MAIEFKCHNCGGSLRVMDEHGDRHGRCPFCHKLLKIPASSRPVDHLVGEATEEITASILEEAAAATEPPLPDFEPDVPDLGPAPVPVSAPPKMSTPAAKGAPRKKAPAPPPPPKDAKSAINFECLLCGEEISVGKDMAGKKISCPGCQEMLTVPSS